MSLILTIPLALALAGSWVFCLLTVIAARSYRRQSTPPVTSAPPPLSVLKPLHGMDEGLEENLRSFFEQDYPEFELLFAASADDDPGLAAARRIATGYPNRPSRFLVTGQPPIPNAKAYSLDLMTGAARHNILVMADSDIRAPRNLLLTLAAEFQDSKLGVATCPYRAIAGRSFWSALEALGMNTEFWGGIFTARLVERGVHFAVGPTTAARKQAIAGAGGWQTLRRYLAEDFVLGQFASRADWRVILSRAIVEHRIGSQAMRANFAHRLRWNRSTRRSRPAGYAGLLFTYPLPSALLLTAAAPPLAWLILPSVVLRTWAGLEVAHLTLGVPLCQRLWWLLPFQDGLSFIFWLAGFFGRSIDWRGRRYLIDGNGMIRPL